MSAGTDTHTLTAQKKNVSNKQPKVGQRCSSQNSRTTYPQRPHGVFMELSDWLINDSVTSAGVPRTKAHCYPCFSLQAKLYLQQPGVPLKLFLSEGDRAMSSSHDINGQRMSGSFLLLLELWKRWRRDQQVRGGANAFHSLRLGVVQDRNSNTLLV